MTQPSEYDTSCGGPPFHVLPRGCRDRGRMNGLLQKLYKVHCEEIWIYVFPEKELRGLSPFPHSCVSERSKYSHNTIGPPIFLQQNRQTENGGNIYIAHRNMNVCRNCDWGRAVFFSENICLEFSVLCLCSVRYCTVELPLQCLRILTKLVSMY